MNHNFMFELVAGWEREVIIASTPHPMYSFLAGALFLLCAVFVAITVRYGLKQ